MVCDGMPNKVVFKDGENTKVIHGSVNFEGNFVKVVDSAGKAIYINRENIVFIREE